MEVKVMKLLQIAALLLAGSQVSAQTNCAATGDVYSIMIDRYGESRIALGLSGKGYLVEFWGNEESQSWTAIVTRPDGVSCIVDQGGQFIRGHRKGQL
jgi:hypothetical protein